MSAILLVRCDPSDTFGVAVGAIRESGAEIEIWEAFEGDPRPSIDGIGGVVVLGSTYNVEHADEQSFIKDVRELTLEAIDRRIPYLGVCFGAQLLAWSLDADVVKAPVRELGYEEIVPTVEADDDLLLSHFRAGDRGFEWHMDTFTMPRGAELLATGHGVRNQAYRVGDRTWGIQFHFEVDRPELEMWLDEYSKKDDLAATWGKSTDQIRAEADAHQAAHEQRGREIFRRFASLSDQH
jgi:GMP synthase-like glutamine amidotransferase